MLVTETLVDVLSCLNRGTLDTVQIASKSFMGIVDAKLVNVCLRHIHKARFQRDAGSYTVVIRYGVHGYNELKIEGIIGETAAVREMLQLCRAATIDVLKLYDSTTRFQSIRTATFEALIDYTHTFVARRITFGLTGLANDAYFGLFMRALKSTKRLESLCPPSLTSSEEESVKHYCKKLGIEFTLSLF